MLLTILLATAVSGLGFSWQQINIPTYGAIGMSGDGRVVCAVPSAGHPSVSTDSGNTWKAPATGPTSSSLFPTKVAVSADGGKIFAVLSSNALTGIFKSSDYGNNWSRTSFPSISYASNSPVSCSADGSIVVAAARNGSIYYSADGGATCSTSSVPNLDWQSIASSADGGRMVAAVGNGSIYFSADFGATWAATNLPAESWNSVCISSDGQWVGAISLTNSYISSNSGVTWQTNQIGGMNIVCSADGTHWLIVGAQIFTSTNSGITWQTNLDTAPLWSAASMSADGSEVALLEGGAGTWLGRETPSPRLQLRNQGSTLELSWLLSSTNFVLQETTDVTSDWVTVPISPALIFTNLQQEITLPVTTHNAFFRLMAQ